VSAQEAGASPQAAPAVAPQAFQVARLGDSQKSCETLIAEINGLNGELTTAQGAMSERAMSMGRSRMGGMQAQSAASAVLSIGGSVAAALIPGAALAVGAVQSVADMAGQAAAEVQQEREMNAMMDDMTAASTALMPLMNRIDHLTDISISKGC